MECKYFWCISIDKPWVLYIPSYLAKRNYASTIKSDELNQRIYMPTFDLLFIHTECVLINPKQLANWITISYVTLTWYCWIYHLRKNYIDNFHIQYINNNIEVLHRRKLPNQFTCFKVNIMVDITALFWSAITLRAWRKRLFTPVRWL